MTESRSTSPAPRSAATSSERGKEERRPQLDEREHASPHRRDALDRTLRYRRDTAEIDSGVLPSVRAVEVDQPTRGEVVLQRPRRLLVDGLPGAVGDGGEVSQQMVHSRFPLSFRRSPMPRLPSRTRARAMGFSEGGATLVRVFASVCSKASSRSGISRIALPRYDHRAVGMRRHVQPIAERAERAVDEGHRGDAVHRRADRRGDFDLGCIRLDRAARDDHLATRDRQRVHHSLRSRFPQPVAHLIVKGLDLADLVDVGVVAEAVEELRSVGLEVDRHELVVLDEHR